jgi:hypothetical protein
VFGLTYVNQIADAYAAPNTRRAVATLDDRGRDICEPLFTVAHVIGEEAERALAAAVQEIATERRTDDVSTEGELEAARVLLLRWVMRYGGRTGWVILRTPTALTIFQGAGLSGVEKESDAQSILRRLGFNSSTHRDPMTGDPIRGYKLTRQALARDGDDEADADESEGDEDTDAGDEHAA